MARATSQPVRVGGAPVGFGCAPSVGGVSVNGPKSLPAAAVRRQAEVEIDHVDTDRRHGADSSERLRGTVNKSPDLILGGAAREEQHFVARLEHVVGLRKD